MAMPQPRPTGIPQGLAFLALMASAVAAAQPRIFWLDYLGTVYSSRPDGSDRKVLVNGASQGLDGPDGIAVDTLAGKIYWSNMAEGRPTGSLQRANLDGTAVEYVVKPGETHTPKQIQLDLVHGKIYWSDRDGFKIQRSNLDGSANEILVSGLQNPVGMALDIAAGHFYWSDRYAGTIARAPMDMPAGQTPANRKDIDTLLSGLARPIDLALDIPKDQLYWTDRDEGTVHRAGLRRPAGQGHARRTDIETLLRNLSTPIGISLDLAGGKLYYTELTGKVGRADLDGANNQTLWDKPGSAAFTGIAFALLPEKSSRIRQVRAGPLRKLRIFALLPWDRNALGRTLPPQW